MKISGPDAAVLLRIYISELDCCHGKPLYEALVLAARDAGLAGATVLRGPLGFGHSSRIHSAKILRLSDDLPVIIQIVDEAAKIEAFLPRLDEMMESGFATLADVRLLRYGPKPA